MNTSELKVRLMDDLWQNKNIVSLIDADDVLYPDELVYTHIYPYLKIDSGIQQEVKTYIGIKIDYPSIPQKDIYAAFQLTVAVFCHQSKMKTKLGGTRADLIADAIIDMWNGDTSGEFRFDLISNKEDVLDHNYYYRKLVFKSMTIQRSACQ